MLSVLSFLDPHVDRDRIGFGVGGCSRTAARMVKGADVRWTRNHKDALLSKWKFGDQQGEFLCN